MKIEKGQGFKINNLEERVSGFYWATEVSDGHRSVFEYDSEDDVWRSSYELWFTSELTDISERIVE